MGNHNYFGIQGFDVDKLIHEPARLKILLVLYQIETADFNFLLNETGLTKGNLSSHLAKLEEKRVISVKKHYLKKIPHTILTITPNGRTAFENYREIMLHILNI